MEKRPKRDRKPKQKSELDQRLRSIITKLDKSNVEGGIRIPVGDDKIADSTVDNYAALKTKHPQRETCFVPDTTDIEYFSTSEFLVHEALLSFPNISTAGLDGISPNVLKELTAKWIGQTGLTFLRALTNRVNVILQGKVPFDFRPYFFGAVVRKMCRILFLRNTSSKIRKSKIVIDIKRGAELDSQVFRCLKESPQP